MNDPIDDLLAQARAYAEKRLDDPTFVDFDYKVSDTTSYNVISSGKHAFIEMREQGDGECNQRGMYAKCNIKAGTKVVISKPIVVHWDAEDEDEEEDEGQLPQGSDEVEDFLEGNDTNDLSDNDHEQDQLAAEAGKKKATSDDDQKKPASAKRAAMDDEENGSDGEEDEEDGPSGTKRNGILILRALEKIKATPKLWTNTLSNLFPRDEESALSLPPWFCSDASVGMEIEMQMANLSDMKLFGKMNDEVCREIAMRLPLIIRYNVLSIETSSELFVYPDVNEGGMASLAGTGLYGPEVSYFNHSCKPNLSRYCIGDVMFFVANRDVKKGEELCFSYIEHELLCENAVKRNALLDMDFELVDNDEERGNNDDKEPPIKKQKVAKMPSKEDDKDEIPYPLIDAEMQSELMATPASERLELIDELLSQEVDPTQDYQCDKFQLHILKAISLEGLGHSKPKKGGLENALSEWERALKFAVTNFPSADETKIALHVQAALCASVNEFGEKEKAKNHADKALEMHDLLFGGGKERFLTRYIDEFMNGQKMRAVSMSESQLMSNLQELWGFTDEMWSKLSS